jgi:nitrite reductase/ring-hydroxylating ferredoxin subunit
MRDVGQRVLIGLAAVAVGVMVIGYAFIAGNIAAPIRRDLGTVEIPRPGGADGVLLDDGRPAFVVADEGQVIALDARAPHEPGAPGRLVAWCQLEATGMFVDLVDGSSWDADGALRSDGRGGLVRYPVREAGEGRVSVGGEGRSAGVADGERVGLDCVTNQWVAHAPLPGEVFDPSVAAAQEPPGWIWLEGTLAARDGEVLLCDGLDETCATGATVRGIDPAMVPRGDRRLAGLFLGRVRDDAIDDLNAVPSPGGTSR